MSILHIVPSYKPAYIYGGTIESIARLCEGLVQAGEEVKVFTTTANGKTELNVTPNREYDVDGVSVIYFKRIFKDPFYISPALWKQLYRNCKNYEVVHIHSWWNILVMVAAFICKMRKVKMVISPHGMMSDYIRIHSRKNLKTITHAIAGKTLLKASVFHATSHAESAECKHLIPGWEGFVLPNVIWLPELNRVRSPNTVFTIVYLSRIHPKKGIEILMEAISNMQVKPLLQIAGTGEEDYIQKLKQKAETLGITEYIEWLGWQNREEKFTRLMQADLFALTSHNENFGNVIVEALYAGTPVLITDKTGLSDFVLQYDLGWVCTPDAADIKRKLCDARADTGKRQRISNAAPLIVSNYLSADKLIPGYLKHYRS